MLKKRLTIVALCLAGAVLAACSGKEEKTEGKTFVQKDTSWPEAGMTDKTYINNGTVQLGVDLDRGGGVFHFSTKKTKKNLLNHFDNGRLVQQSYYGEVDGSTWSGRTWRWNPSPPIRSTGLPASHSRTSA